MEKRLKSEDAFQAPVLLTSEPFPSHWRKTSEPKSVLGTQVGGSHYTDLPIQPIQYIWANNIGFSEGNVIKYVSRWKSKGGIKDLEKAHHHLALLIEREKAKVSTGGNIGFAATNKPA